MGSYTFDIAGAHAKIVAKVAAGINQTLAEIDEIAYHLAPVRKKGRRKKRAVQLGKAGTQHFARVGKQSFGVTSGELFKAYQRAGGTATRPQFRTLRIVEGANKRVIHPDDDSTIKRVEGSKSGKLRGVTLGSEAGGFLRDSIEVVQATAKEAIVIGSVRVNAPYARYVEFPTHRTAAQPFLLPAFKAARGRFKANLKAAKGL